MTAREEQIDVPASGCHMIATGRRDAMDRAEPAIAKDRPVVDIEGLLQYGKTGCAESIGAERADRVAQRLRAKHHAVFARNGIADHHSSRPLFRNRRSSKSPERLRLIVVF